VVKRIGAVVLLVATLGLAVVAEQRIFTNPRPEGYFKTLFPNAAAFSTFGGAPLHWKAYGVDPKAAPTAPPIGIIFWTTDMVPNEVGYHGPIHMLVGLDMSGIITGVIVDYNSEPYGYFSVEPPKFAAQFQGKSVRDPFRVGGDVDAVSRATITISSAARAIRDSSRIVARALLNPDMVKPPQP
jgi:transcriptional regulator of nitric oxide reductase